MPSAAAAQVPPQKTALETATIAPLLRSRVEEVIDNHRAAESHATEAIRAAAAAGRGLESLKDELRHGEFIPFVEEHLPFTRQTASSYMRIARAIRSGELQMESASSIRGALKQLATPKPATSTAATTEEAPKTYELNTERKRQIAEKAAERFWAVINQLTTFDQICDSDGKSAGETLCLDRVLAVTGDQQIKETIIALDGGIKRARELREALANRLPREER